ncbi:MAG: ABC transporter ATP-binding protein [Proteobacteria bacterium]|nr:ABC transporter ATP-binding protein [Pseudomonadota bacterium]
MIDVHNLVFSYPKQPKPTLKGLNFRIEEGEIFGFLGPSGAGKSTTQKILIGLLKGYQGEVSILNRDARDWGTEIYSEVGVGFELPNHFSQLTGIENLKLFSSLYRKKTRDPMELLELVGIADAAEQRVKNYSKGMAMRLNFVRALLHDPRLLFLDEPTAGLDPANARNLKDIILEQKRARKTIFLTTHNMHDADELCDRVAFLVDGEIKLIDAPRSLRLAKGQKQVRVEYTIDETQHQETFDLRGLRNNQEFMKILETDTLQTIHSQEATLEDVFIRTTGRSLQ